MDGSQVNDLDNITEGQHHKEAVMVMKHLNNENNIWKL